MREHGNVYDPTKLLLIVGQPCGGTTLVAQILSCCGMYGGDDLTKYMEAKEGLGFRQCYQGFDEVKPHYGASLDLEIKGITEYILRERGTYSYFKDPCGQRLFEHLDIPLQILSVERSLTASAMSASKRWGWSKRRSQNIMSQLEQSRQRLFRKNTPLYIIDYDELVDNPKQEITSLMREFSGHMGHLQQAINLVDPKLRHFSWAGRQER